MWSEYNISNLRTKLERLYSTFEDESRNFKLFVVIHEYISSLQDPLSESKVKEYQNITNKSLEKIKEDDIDGDSLEYNLDIISNAIDSVGAFCILVGVYEIMEKYRGEKQIEVKNKLDNNFTKKYKKFLDFLLYTLHEDIMEHLDELEFINNNDNKDKIIFDKEKSILYIKGKKIKIKRKADFPLEHYILEYLFEQEDKNDEVYFKDIAQEKLNEYDYNGLTDWKRYYRACERLQEKIRIDTNITDFLLFSTGKTGNVKINKKYFN